MLSEAARLQAAISSLLTQRALLGDVTVDTAVGALRDKLAQLDAAQAKATAAAEQTLKQVTVLFLDVVGSTALSQHLDPEEINEVMDGTLARCTAIVLAQRGRVLQYAGDSLLAVFGADVAGEDDAERAVRAGLALLAEGRLQGARVLAAHGQAGFNLRVGLHTGGVLLGGGVDGENTIRGLTVNIAARLEQTAPPGTLRISLETYAHVRGRFDVQPQPPMMVKGRDEPLDSFLVAGERSRGLRSPSRGVEGLLTPMVGRQAELHALQDAYAAVQAAPMLHGVTVVAEAGLGKSRLLAEFDHWLSRRGDGARTLRARALPASRSQPHGLLRELFADALQITDGDSAALAGAKFEAGVARLFEADQGPALAQAQAHVLGYLLGLDFAASHHLDGLREAGQTLRNRAFHVARLWLQRLARESSAPLVVMLDDLHWADEGSLLFVSQWWAAAGSATEPAPLLLLCGARPSLFELRPGWPGQPAAAMHRQIMLKPLDDGGSAALASALLGRLQPASELLHDLITTRAEGNPYYMEEIVRMLIDNGAITADGDRWQLHAERLLAAPVPTTLAGVLQARLDSLPAEEKAGLQGASVIGQRFWDQALAELVTPAPPTLDALARRALVHAQDTLLAPDVREYLFHHQILHEVTYDTVLKRVRRAWHLKAAQWLAALDSAQADNLLADVAEHFERGGDAAQAAEYFTRAAEHLAGRYAHETVVTLVGRALSLAATDAQALRFRGLHMRQRSLRVLGRMAEQAQDLVDLQSLADQLGDDRRLAAAGLSRAVALSSSGDARGCASACEQALLRAQRAGADDVAAGIYSAWTGALRSLGAFDEALPIVHDGLALARRVGDRMHESELLTILAAVATDRGDAVGATALLRQSLAIDREIGNSATEGPALINLGDAALRLGDYATAQRDLDAALTLARAVGTRGLESVCRLNLGSVALFQGDHATAIAHASAARDIAAAVGNTEYEAFAWMGLGHATLAAGQLAAAQAAYGRSRDLLDGMAMGHLGVEAEAGLARVALARSDAAAAQAHVTAVLAHLDHHGQLDGCEHPLWIRLTCWQVLAPAGDARGLAQLKLAHAELMATAQTVTPDAARQLFLQAVPHHRLILAAWPPAA